MPPPLPPRPISADLQPQRPARRRCRRAGVGLLVALLLVAAYAGLNRFVLPGPVDARTLARSLDRKVGRGDVPVPSPRCRPTTAADVWRCTIADISDSNGARYVVRVRADSSCWRAERVPPYGPSDLGPRPRATGCVTRW
jgi:hypothetical protein